MLLSLIKYFLNLIKLQKKNKDLNKKILLIKKIYEINKDIFEEHNIVNIELKKKIYKLV